MVGAGGGGGGRGCWGADLRASLLLTDEAHADLCDPAEPDSDVGLVLTDGVSVGQTPRWSGGSRTHLFGF